METMGRRRRSSSRISVSLLLILVSATSIASVSAGYNSEHRLGWIPLRSAFPGTIAGEEFDLSSESTRRILSDSGFISYDALKRGSVPCSLSGASYYNCRPGAEANPYSRGCSAITQCRG